MKEAKLQSGIHTAYYFGAVLTVFIKEFVVQGCSSDYFLMGWERVIKRLWPNHNLPIDRSFLESPLALQKMKILWKIK